METLKPHFDQWQMRILYEQESTNEKPALSHMTKHQPMRNLYCVTWSSTNQWWLSIHSWLCYWFWCWHPSQWTACVHLSVIVATKLFIVKVRKKQNLGTVNQKINKIRIKSSEYLNTSSSQVGPGLAAANDRGLSLINLQVYMKVRFTFSLSTSGCTWSEMC